MKAIEVSENKSAICQEILDDLPAWFGLPDAKAAYVSAVSILPMFVIFDLHEPVAFLVMKRQTSYAAELYVLGVKARLHRQGLGRSLIDAALDFAGRERVRLLTVKTLAASHSDPNYEKTRQFHEAMSFLPVEVLPNLWRSSHPCLLMIRAI